MRTLILGFDAFDPALFQTLADRGELPHLAGRLAAGQFRPFQVTNPPQSEVSWTSIATGLHPAAHGMFDFVHRDPATYALSVSLLPEAKGRFVRPFNARTIFDIAAERGYPATSLWWPATFPARLDSPVRTLPGLGTPDIQGRLGVGMLFTTDPDTPERTGKTPVRRLERTGRDAYAAQLEGPLRPTAGGAQPARLDLHVRLLDGGGLQRVEARLGDRPVMLTPGRWSEVIELRFKLGPFSAVHAITRLIVAETAPHLRLYALPLQIHPLHPVWPYGTPPGFVKDAWRSAGPFLTLGWPQDTTGLEDGCISDAQFLDLCESIVAARLSLLLREIDRFKEGLLASVFDSLDRIQHMFWGRDPELIERWYRRFDAIAAEVSARLAATPGEVPRLLIVSDHGFGAFDYKVHLNRWLLDHGYLAAHGAEGAAADAGAGESPAAFGGSGASASAASPRLDDGYAHPAPGSPPAGPPSGDFKQIDWERTRFYAIGLNSLYLNLAGREGRGCVDPADAQAAIDALCSRLSQWTGPDGRRVVQRIYRREGEITGPLAEHGPDLLIGYSPGYRGSAETGLGGWQAAPLERNRDHWCADHCFDAASVPGVLFASGKKLAGGEKLTGGEKLADCGLSNYPAPSYADIPALAIDAAPDTRLTPPPPTLSPEDQEKVEERLRSLGYL